MATHIPSFSPAGSNLVQSICAGGYFATAVGAVAALPLAAATVSMLNCISVRYIPFGDAGVPVGADFVSFVVAEGAS